MLNLSYTGSLIERMRKLFEIMFGACISELLLKGSHVFSEVDNPLRGLLKGWDETWDKILAEEEGNSLVSSSSDHVYAIRSCHSEISQSASGLAQTRRRT
jgi:hypothetical protein